MLGGVRGGGEGGAEEGAVRGGWGGGGGGGGGGGREMSETRPERKAKATNYTALFVSRL